MTKIHTQVVVVKWSCKSDSEKKTLSFCYNPILSDINRVLLLHFL